MGSVRQVQTGIHLSLIDSRRRTMGGFIAQALALNYADRINKLVLLSTDSGGIEADLASPDVRSELVDTSGTPNAVKRDG
jgi:pimeloyl-ACP methyl ester carboxylesterase